MRVFIAYEFDSKIKDYLSKVQNIVRNNSYKGNFTLYDNFHLTLKFIGEIRENQLNELYDILDKVSEEYKAFNIKIGDLGSFKRKDKHIVFVDVIKNQDKLSKLANLIDNKLLAYEFEERKGKFKAHITIGREVILRKITVLETILPFIEEIPINRISLMLSDRNQKNILTYTPLYTVKLK